MTPRKQKLCHINKESPSQNETGSLCKVYQVVTSRRDNLEKVKELFDITPCSKNEDFLIGKALDFTGKGFKLEIILYFDWGVDKGAI